MWVECASTLDPVQMEIHNNRNEWVIKGAFENYLTYLLKQNECYLTENEKAFL